MVTAVQIRRRVRAKSARRPEPTAPLPPMTGAQALAYWKRTNALGVYSDRAVYPQDAPELARALRDREEARE